MKDNHKIEELIEENSQENSEILDMNKTEDLQKVKENLEKEETEIEEVNSEIETTPIDEDQEDENVSENNSDEYVASTDIEPIAEYEETYVNEINEPLSSEEEKTVKHSFLSSVEKSSDSYVDYNMRLLGKGLMFIALFIITIIFLQGAFNTAASQQINYKESSNLDYKVYLKENKFYDEEYLGKDKVYIANLINNIEVNFRYNYNIEKESNVDFNYSIVAKLTIDDGTSKNNYFEKEYVLLSNKKASITNETSYFLNEKVVIDYAYYNSLANNFNQQYGVDTTSNLTIYLKVNKKSNIENATNTLDNSTMYVKIPLSEKSVNIELNYQDINNSNYIIETNDSLVDNVIFGVLALISFVAALVVAIKLIRLLTLLRGKQSIYDKYINRILNEYDRLIVENSTGPDTHKSNVIKISKFEELLDVRDNLKLPIMYYVITKHTKCCFYIKHNKDLYLMTIKAVDLEQAKEENK